MKIESINHVTIVGAGMIGASLSALFTGNGYRTTMLALDSEQAAGGHMRYTECFRDLIAKGLVTQKQADACAKLFSVTENYEDVADTDFVYECVFEDLKAKHQVFAMVEKHCDKYQALASSTSALDSDELAAGVAGKGKFTVAHPCNPPHLVPFVEIVPGRETLPETDRLVYDLLESTGRKVVIMKKSVPGFITNRLQHALFREAIYMVEQGIAEPKDIDKTLKYSIMPRYTSIGIFEHIDNAGIDLSVKIEDYLFPYLSNARRASDFLRSKVEAGDNGIKTGVGVYDWRERDIDAFRLDAAKPYFPYFNWNLPED